MSSQIEIVRRYLALVETLKLEEGAAGVLHAEYLQWELPNALNPKGQKSDRADTFRRMGLAGKIMAKQKYEISSVLEQKNTVVVEALWNGEMAMDAGPLKKGQVLKAFFCMFFEFKDGVIFRVRNYDCFEPLV